VGCNQNTIHNLLAGANILLLGGGLFGFDISSISAIISIQPYLCQFNQLGHNDNGLCLGPTSMTQGGITAAMPGGSWLGALVSGYLSDMFGRKKSIQIGSVIW
jgi:MFS family permease